MNPRRIRLSRKKGFRLPPETVVVSRPSKFGNPFKVGVDGDAAECVRLFEAETHRDSPGCRLRFTGTDLLGLRGKNLACWCRLDQPCHADVLLRLANEGCDR